METNSSNPIVRYGILIADIAVLNLLLILFFRLMGLALPSAFALHSYAFFITANACLIVSAFFIPEIVSVRLVKFHSVIKRVFSYVLLFTLMFFFTVRVTTDGGGLFRFMVLYSPSLFVALIISRWFELSFLRHWRMRSKNMRKVIFVGNDPSLLRVYASLGGSLTSDYIIEGYFANEPITSAPEDLKWLGNTDEMHRRMEKFKDLPSHNIDDVFVSISHSESKEVEKIALYCDEHSIHFYYVPREFPNSKLNLLPENFGGMHLYTNHREPLMDPRNAFVKRLFDVVVSFIACLFILILTPIIGLIIKIQSPGPIFFKQKRTGINGLTFNCFKFRSMHVNKDADKVQATKNDPRKFAFGNFMRKTNIDELPQFFNVLIGDMSIVGPRPHMLAHTEEYSRLIKTYMVRHFCRPGITGLAQIKGFRGETKELWQMEGRVRYDIEYIERWSFWLDMKIIAYTALSIVHPDKHAY